MKDSEIKQREANEIVAALARAGIKYDKGIIRGYVDEFDDLPKMPLEEACAIKKRAHDAFESIGRRLRDAGEHEIADNYFKFPNQTDHLAGYLPK